MKFIFIGVLYFGVIEHFAFGKEEHEDYDAYKNNGQGGDPNFVVIWANSEGYDFALS